MMVNHMNDLQRGYGSFAKSRKIINQAMKTYEDSYGESVEFGHNSNDEDRKEAAENAGSAFPGPEKTSEEDQQLYDKIGGGNSDLTGLLTDPLGPKGQRKFNKQQKKEDRDCEKSSH